MIRPSLLALAAATVVVAAPVAAMAQDASYYFQQGLQLRSRNQPGDMQAALEDFKKAHEMEPSNTGYIYSYAGTLYRLGVMAEEQKSWDDAIIYYERIASVIKLNSLEMESECYALGARAYLGRGGAGDAETAARLMAMAEPLEVVPFFKPEVAKTWNQLGDVAYGRGDWDGAVRDYTHAIELDPANGPISGTYFNNRGAAYSFRRAQGDEDRMVADYQSAHRLKPAEPVITKNLAGAINERGVRKYNTHDYAGALADFQIAQQLDGSNQDVANNIRNAQVALNAAQAAPPPPVVAQNDPPPAPPPARPPVSTDCKVNLAKAAFNVGIGFMAVLAHKEAPHVDVDENACDGQ